MALVKCPECGREKVSDSAEMCPDCGYGIKAHFEKIRVEEEQRKQEELLEKQKIEEVEEEHDEWAKQFHINSLKKEVDEHQKLITKMIIALIVFILLLIFSANFEDLGWLLGLSVIASIVIGISVLILFSDKSTLEDRLQLAIKDYEAYDKAMERRRQIEVAKYEQEQAKKVVCPVCNSKNTERISTANRAVSVAAVGLASGKIGKQYKCKNCKHMW